MNRIPSRLRTSIAAALLALCPLCVSAVSSSASQAGSVPPKLPDAVRIDNASLDRLEQWLDAVATHTPGASDQALDTVQSWSTDELRTLWINATALMALMRPPAWKKIVVTAGGLRRGARPLTLTITPEGKPAKEIKYTLWQTQRLKVLACAADGEVFCPEILAAGTLSPPLERLAGLARMSRAQGDDNFVLRHGAMLHADVAIAARKSAGPLEYRDSHSAASPAPDQMQFEMFDGSGIGSREVGIHWILARMLLDEVIPAGGRKPEPGRDEGVRDWYRATAAWMQRVEDHDTQHLDRARELFASDPDILFLSGCQREMFAESKIQSAVRASTVPAGFRIDIESDQKEVRRAEDYLRRAIAARPGMAEAHLHLGHVLLMRADYADAAVHLREAGEGPLDSLLQYYRALMLGAAEEHLARFDAARDSYEAAAALQPAAQSPLIGLSELERRRGDRTAALRELQGLFDLPADAPSRDDPWWRYDTSHVRQADALVESLRQSVLRAGSKLEHQIPTDAPRLSRRRVRVCGRPVELRPFRLCRAFATYLEGIAGARRCPF